MKNMIGSLEVIQSSYYADTGITFYKANGDQDTANFSVDGLRASNYLEHVKKLLLFVSNIRNNQYVKVEVSGLTFDYLFPKPEKSEAELKIEAAEKLLVEAKALLKK